MVVGVVDVSLLVNWGEIFCVMGLFGSGKLMLVCYFNCFLEFIDGKILIEGMDVVWFGFIEL